MCPLTLLVSSHPSWSSFIFFSAYLILFSKFFFSRLVSLSMALLLLDLRLSWRLFVGFKGLFLFELLRWCLNSATRTTPSWYGFQVNSTRNPFWILVPMNLGSDFRRPEDFYLCLLLVTQYQSKSQFGSACFAFLASL